MRAFVFHLHNDARAVQSFELEAFSSLAEAVAHGRDLLIRNLRFGRIVIVDGDAEVALLRRCDAPGVQGAV